MLEWSEYLKIVLESKTVIDQFSLTCGGNTEAISPIVKASILMLEDMISSQGNHNIFVFPEIDRLSREFLLSKVIFNITAGKILMSYDPQKFVKGQILKFRGCAVEFDEIETAIEEGKKYTRIFIKFKDGVRYGIPIQFAPYFQISDSKKLCTYKRFKDFYSAAEAKAAYENPSQTKNYLDTLENHKTHLNSSVFYVSGLKTSREFLTKAELNGKKLTDVLYMAQINGDGDISNVSAGQLSGNPAIIIASDIYSVLNAINKGVSPQSVIFNASQQGAIDKQLDAFDEISRMGFPIVCITDTADSFDLNPLIERNYNIWRWDSDSITEELITKSESNVNDRVKNCFKHKVEYLSVNDENISLAVKYLYSQKNAIEDQSPKITSAYERLFSIAFSMLRTVIPLDSAEKSSFEQIINNCINNIESEKRFISPELYNSLISAAKALLPVFNSNIKNYKYEEICSIVLDKKYNSVCIIIPEKLDRVRCEKYWETLDIQCKISIMYPMEYQEKSEEIFDLIIVVGWLGNKIMRKVIYGFSARNYLVLTYPCEEKWKKSHTKIWTRTLDNSDNSIIVKKSFTKNGRQVSSVRFEHPKEQSTNLSTIDELNDIELVIRSSRYKQYSSSTKSGDIVVAFPVSFVGGFLTFYRSGHKALIATDIITNGGDKIESKLPEKIEVGDFVIIRESEHDIVREIADKILDRSGKSGSRKLSAKWKESLALESLFSSFDEIYQKLCSCGCKKDYMTVKNWITNEDLIQPNDIEDMRFIAVATGDDVLKEKLELVYEAGKDVRSAHIQAGRVLSQKLKNKIAEHLHGFEKIDAFNVWDPITIQLEDIGQVKILKVIDVSPAVPVDSGNTNRLLTE